MNAVMALRESRFRLIWLLLATASAAALTEGVFIRLTRHLDSRLLAGFCLMAWCVLLPAWRRVRQVSPKLRIHQIVAVFVVEFWLIAQLESAFFPLAPVREIAQYQALIAAVQADDLRSVERILRTDHAPDFVPFPAPVYQPRRQWIGSPEVYYVPHPLQLAVAKGEADIADTLIRHGASATSPNLLNEAARGNDVPMLRVLIAHGASANDTQGNSLALYLAAGGDSPQAVSFLLSQGANPNSRISAGALTLTALSHARNLGYDDIVRLLKQAGATE